MELLIPVLVMLTQYALLHLESHTPIFTHLKIISLILLLLKVYVHYLCIHRKLQSKKPYEIQRYEFASNLEKTNRVNR